MLEKTSTALAYMQEVLRCLHSHLGSRAPKQTSTALDALLQLLGADATALLSYAAYLTGMLEYLQHFSHDQVQQACPRVLSSCPDMTPHRLPLIGLAQVPDNVKRPSYNAALRAARTCCMHRQEAMKRIPTVRSHDLVTCCRCARC